MVEFDAFARNVGAKTAKGLPLSASFSMVDAIQEAKFGLVEAARRFDFASHDSDKSSVEAHFKSFAYPRIRGAVIDAARRATFVRRRGIEQGVAVSMLSLDDRHYREEDGFSYPLELSTIEADPDLVIDFQMALKTLTERERYVVMSLGTGTSGKDIADELQVTESRISQIATQAKTKLRKAMEH